MWPGSERVRLPQWGKVRLFFWTLGRVRAVHVLLSSHPCRPRHMFAHHWGPGPCWAGGRSWPVTLVSVQDLLTEAA